MSEQDRDTVRRMYADACARCIDIMAHSKSTNEVLAAKKQLREYDLVIKTLLHKIKEK